MRIVLILFFAKGEYIDPLLPGNPPEPLRDNLPLMSAAASGSLDSVKVLLSAGADATARDETGRTVMGYASGSPAVQQELRRAGARR